MPIESDEPLAFCPSCGFSLTRNRKVEYGNITIDGRDKVFLDHIRVPMAKTQYLIVEALVLAKGRGVSRSTLASIIGRDIYDQSVTKYVQRARQSFRSVKPGFDQLQTVQGLEAYRWLFCAPNSRDLHSSREPARML